MQVKIQPSLRMCTLLLLFLFTSEEAFAEIMTKSVELIIQPGNEVQRGTNVSLICQAEVINSQRTHLNYIFYKDYVRLSTYQTNATDNLYSIPDARVSHSGKYQCAVAGQEKQSKVKDLTVKGLLTPVLEVNKRKLTEGDDVSAVCAAEGETGDLTFYFRDGPEELYRKTTNSPKVEKNLTLTRGQVNMFCYYTINLSGTSKYSDNSSVISINIQELKVKPDIKVMPSTNVFEGDLITFSCSVDMTHQGNSKLKVFLIHERIILSLNMTQENYSMIAKAHESGEYECMSILGGVQKSSSVNITVNELFSVPDLRIHPAEVFEGENFTIRCQISSFASEKIQREDITYSIFRDKTSVIHGNEYSGIAGKVTNGNYMCTATANGITKESQRVLFGAKVLVSKPDITVYDPVILDKPFLIHCHSENGSLPINYTLTRNNIPLNWTKVSEPHVKAQFLAFVSTPSDISSYLCAAQNNARVSVKMSEKLHVTVIVPVGKPLLTVLPVPGNIEEGDDITLICSIAKGSPPISFRFYASNHTPIYTTKVPSNSSSFVLSKVNRENSGNYFCEALNTADMLSTSNIVTVEVSLAKWKKVLIAVFCMLSVALLVLFIVLRYKAKRGKREMAAKLSVKPASRKSDNSLTLSLTHDTHYSTHTVEENNKECVWSERPPDQDSLESPNEGDVEYTEVVYSQPVDPTRIHLRKGTDTVYSELQTSQGASEHINHQHLVEYAELNHDLSQPAD